jgi:hypothetical protein
MSIAQPIKETNKKHYTFTATPEPRGHIVSLDVVS